MYVCYEVINSYEELSVGSAGNPQKPSINPPGESASRTKGRGNRKGVQGYVTKGDSMMKRCFTVVFAFTLILCFKCSSVMAYDLPSVNLGLTSFLDGTPPSGPGHYFTQWVQYYGSKRLNDEDGNPLLPGFADEDLNVWVGVTQYLYLSDQELLFGGKWAIMGILPVVSLDLEYRTSVDGFPQDNSGGLGDIIIAPILQWDPIMGKDGPMFVQRLELQLFFPTGKYDDNRALNPGSNFFSFNPYWAGTLFLGPRWEISTRLHYLWNDKNHDPNNGALDDSQAGQAIHANFAFSYDLLPKRLRVGLNGYYLKQITDTEFDGADVSGRREQIFAIGPGFLYSFSIDNHLFLNTYFETEAENRSEGKRISLRWVHHF